MKTTTAVFGLLLVAMLLIFGTFMVDRLSPVSQNNASQLAATEKLNQSVQAMQARIDQLRSPLAVPTAGASGAVDLDAIASLIDSKLSRLEQRIDALDDSVNRNRLFEESQGSSEAPGNIPRESDVVSTPAPPPTQQLAQIDAVVAAQPSDPDQASALQTTFSQNVANHEFARDLVVDNARCGGRNCLLDVTVPADQDPEFVKDTLADAIPAEYGGYSMIVIRQSDGTHQIAVYLQGPASGDVR